MDTLLKLAFLDYSRSPVATLFCLPVLALFMFSQLASAGGWRYTGAQSIPPVPAGIEIPIPGVTAIAAGGESHTAALKEDGSVIAWGNNDGGQATVPETAQSGVVAIAADRSYTVALKGDGSVVAWGDNSYGQTTVPAAAQSGVTAIAAGFVHTLALKEDGSVVAWGLNNYGETTVPETAQSGVTAIAAGEQHSVALKQDGSVIAWGFNGSGQTTVPAAAQSNVTAIAAGANHLVALKQDGSVVAWGNNNRGQTTVPAAAQSGVIAIAAGDTHTVALKEDGYVVAWGAINANYGQVTVPAEIQGRVTAIAAGPNVTFYRVADLPPTALFATWANNAGLQGDDALPDAIPFDDGVANLLKYSFSLNGAGPDVSRLVPGTGVSGLPFFSVAETESGRVFRVEYLQRKNAGLIYTPKVSTDLAPGSFIPMTGTETVTSIDFEWARVRVEQAITLETVPRLFGVVEVELPEE
jgi:Regulator of chromosome condensation (RCC1) repeat